MKNTYVLIHGAWQSAWCWETIIPSLEAKGHTVIAPDLPGHGNSTEPIADQDMQSYSRYIVSILESAPEPVILVGHSMGGMSISQAAELCPSKVAKLVYVSALLPQNGQSVDGTSTGITPTNWAELASQGIAVDLCDGGKASMIRPDFICPALYNDLPAETHIGYAAHHSKEALAAQYQPVTLSERFLSVPKYYVSCLQDQVVPLSLQEKMLQATPCQKVYQIDSGHAVYLSAPAKLVDVLLQIGEQG